MYFVVPKRKELPAADRRWLPLPVSLLLKAFRREEEEEEEDDDDCDDDDDDDDDDESNEVVVPNFLSLQGLMLFLILLGIHMLLLAKVQDEDEDDDEEEWKWCRPPPTALLQFIFIVRERLCVARARERVSERTNEPS